MLSSTVCEFLVSSSNHFLVSAFLSRESYGERTTVESSLEANGCDSNGNNAIVVHGFQENISTPWVNDIVRNLLFYRGGCVIFMDYSNYSSVFDYRRLVPHFNRIADVLFQKVQQVKNYGRLYMFGFSFGSRLCFEVGARMGNQVIERIDACDPAGPGFDYLLRTVDPKRAAKHVTCINTSASKGTAIYNCHQNFLMGRCGKSQPAASWKPFGNHGLCPYFYNSAFSHKFTPNNLYNCTSIRSSMDVPDDLRFGYLNTNFIQGDFFVPTSKDFPWNDFDNSKM